MRLQTVLPGSLEGSKAVIIVHCSNSLLQPTSKIFPLVNKRSLLIFQCNAPYLILSCLPDLHTPCVAHEPQNVKQRGSSTRCLTLDFFQSAVYVWQQPHSNSRYSHNFPNIGSVNVITQKRAKRKACIFHNATLTSWHTHTYITHTMYFLAFLLLIYLLLAWQTSGYHSFVLTKYA